MGQGEALTEEAEAEGGEEEEEEEEVGDEEEDVDHLPED